MLNDNSILGYTSTGAEIKYSDFKKNIYKHDLEVQFIRKIRKEKKFFDSFYLIKQIKKDIIEAKSIISSTSPPLALHA